MASAENHYSPPLEELEGQRERIESVPIHIERIREEIERVSGELIEANLKQEEILEKLERQSQLLESIDHAHYHLRTKEAEILSRIFSLLLVSIISFGAYFLFSS